MRFATAPYRHCWKLCLSRQVGIPLCGTRFIGECLPNGRTVVSFSYPPGLECPINSKIYHNSSGGARCPAYGVWRKAGQVENPDLIGAAPPTRSPFLLQDDHLSQLRIIARPQLVEIDTTGNPLSQSVSAIPIRRTTAVRVVPRTLMPQIQFAHQRTVHVVDREGHIGVVC